MDRSFYISASELLDKKIVPKWDFHIHTNYTDGKVSVEQVFKSAIDKGLEIIIFTEHTEKWRTVKEDWFLAYCVDIEKNRMLFSDKIKAFIGVETNAISFKGEVDLSDIMKERAEFVLGAAHRYPGIEGRKVADLSAAEAIDLEYATLMGLAESHEIDAIAHIGATCTKYCSPFPKELSREIIRKAVKNNICIEVNPVYHKPLLCFIEMCAEEGAFITLGSNSHGYNDIGLIGKELNTLFSS